MDNNLEEKKCPVCGRPNINKAKKCWYCQSPIEEEQNTRQQSLLSEEEMLEQNGEGSSFVQSSLAEKKQKTDDETPEWLRRVRELIAAEKIEEEPDEAWQQEHLFDTPPKKQDTKETAQPQANSQTPKAERMDFEADIQEPSSEDLPAGFTPFSNHEED